MNYIGDLFIYFKEKHGNKYIDHFIGKYVISMIPNLDIFILESGHKKLEI